MARTARRLLPPLLSLLAACGEEPAPAGAVLTVWAHAGQAAERAVIEAQAARFAAARPERRVELGFIPERTYNAQVQAAAVAGALPDVLELDGPYVASYAWQGRLAPLDEHLPKAVVDDLLPSIRAQGTWEGRLYGVGTFDSGLGLFARRGHLERARLRIPDGPGDAWSAAETDAALAALAAGDADGAVLDLKLNYPPEWITYAFSPLLRSAGGDLVARTRPVRAAGVLNGPASVTALARVQAWLAAGYVDPNVDDAAFVSGRTALSWAGHWEHRRYREAFGDDLLVLPLPDFGDGTRTGQGSWVWAVSAASARKPLAAEFVAFLLGADEILVMTGANGAVPATRTAIARSPLYGPRGPLRLFAEQLAGGHAVPRPRTPAYPTITQAFQRAFAQIRDGAPVREALDEAAAAIDREVADNRGYPGP